ncbi:NAD(P)/FAD-dependent oxidoreductase [Fluviicola taffensis]|uniref:FAD dependent oxidoreductase n=1 Tax=Fluviicola taffensis (strain DSM 16823 / NCIMB 13979 / RW262) TaxID=755732 RepID=F2II83_FLUTR|nr:FAD-dependent oxidoreductase [Fluviicola taffensis]AEA43792.1 FAD dependent oxidoreductase [Fluviicola taffensis DSM 16823]
MKVLVVGCGVTGICLTHELLQADCEVQIIDNGKNVSSTVAAGIINPLVFRRMTLSWRVSEFIPFATKKYQEFEQKINASFFHPLVIRRLFPSVQELDFWKKKQDLPEYSDYMETLTEEDLHFPIPQNTFGTARVKQASYIDAKEFVSANKDYFRTQKILLDESFNHNELDPETAVYKGVSFDFILFAEGKDSSYNPLFGYLPLQLTKGEVLTIQSDTFYAKESLNRKCFLLPIGNSQFKVGSTYVWDTDNTIPTEEGLKTITENLKSLSSEPYQIVEHSAGVRPTVLDRRPLLGKHPKFPKMVIANGLGAKGYMLAPLLMHELVKHILEGYEIPTDSHIKRFESLIHY